MVVLVPCMNDCLEDELVRLRYFKIYARGDCLNLAHSLQKFQIFQEVLAQTDFPGLYLFTLLTH